MSTAWEDLTFPTIDEETALAEVVPERIDGYPVASPAEKAAQRLGYEPFSYNERS